MLRLSEVVERGEDAVSEYIRFVQEHGHIRDNLYLAEVVGDVRLPALLSGLENSDGTSTLTLSRDIPEPPPIQGDKTERIRQAFYQSCLRRGNAELTAVATMAGVSQAEAEAVLSEIALPTKSSLESSSKYVPLEPVLTGSNIYETLLDYCEQGPSKATLEEYLPPMIALEEVSFNLSSPWIAPRFKEEFLGMKGAAIAVEGQDWKPSSNCLAVPLLAASDIRNALAENEGEWERLSKLLDISNLSSVFLVSKKKRKCILSDVLKGVIPRISLPGGVESPFLDEILQQALDGVQGEFREFILGHPEREQIEWQYNRAFNGSVAVDWDGIAELGDNYTTIRWALQSSGASLPWVERLREYQLDAIYRYAFSEKGLLAFEPGLGKTAVMLAAALLKKEWGRIQQPLFVVQKTTLKQFEATAREMFPGKRVLVAESCGKLERQALMMHIASHLYDVVLVSHNFFEAIPLTSKEGVAWEDLGVDYLVVDECQRYKNLIGTTSFNIRGISSNVSQCARSLHSKLPKQFLLATGTPEPTNSVVGLYSMLCYLAPDDLEAWSVKGFDDWVRLFGHVESEYEPTMRGGFEQVIRLRKFSNLPELWNIWKRFVYRKTVDDVINTIGFPELKFEKVSCPLSDAQLNNLDDIHERYHRCSQGIPRVKLKTTGDGAVQAVDANDEIGTLVVPGWGEVKAGNSNGFYDKMPQDLKPNTVFLVVEKGKASLVATDGRGLPDGMRTQHLRKFMQENKLHPYISRDNHLAIYGALRMNSVAPQLIKPSPIAPTEKVAVAAKKIAEMYHDKPGTTQLVFCDLGTPGGVAAQRFDLYNEVKAQCIALGVLPEDVAFIQEYKSDSARKDLFNKVNSGEIRILFGSTSCLGIGVDVQVRCAAIHLLDVPFRPDEFRQRIGRGWRSGNLNPEVLVFQYLSEGSKGAFGADTMSFSLLQYKADLQEHLWKHSNDREFEEQDDSSALFMLLMAESTGNENWLEFCKVESRIKSIRAQLVGRQMELARLTADKGRKGSIAYLEEQRQWWQRFLADIEQKVVEPLESSPYGSGRLILEFGECKGSYPQCVALTVAKPERQQCIQVTQLLQARRPSPGTSTVAAKVVGADGIELTLSTFESGVTNLALEAPGGRRWVGGLLKTPERCIARILEYLEKAASRDIPSKKIASFDARLNKAAERLERIPLEMEELEAEAMQFAARRDQLMP